MKRRPFLQKISLGALFSFTSTFSAFAASRSPTRKIGFLISAAGYETAWDALTLSLKQKGWIEGKNLQIVTKKVNSQRTDIADKARELIELGCELIVTTGASTAKEILKLTSTLPIIDAGMVDPVLGGLVTSLSHPNTNLTGISILFDDISLKLLELILSLDPQTKEIATLSNPQSTTNPRVPDKLTKVGATMGIRNQVFLNNNVSEMASIFKQMQRNRQKFLIVLQSPYFVSNSAPIAKLAIEYNIAVLGQEEVYTQAGFFASYGVDYIEIFQRSATYVDKVLKGAKVNQLPIEQATTLELILNLKTVKALNYKVPPKLEITVNKFINS